MVCITNVNIIPFSSSTLMCLLDPYAMKRHSSELYLHIKPNNAATSRTVRGLPTCTQKQKCNSLNQSLTTLFYITCNNIINLPKPFADVHGLNIDMPTFAKMMVLPLMGFTLCTVAIFTDLSRALR